MAGISFDWLSQLPDNFVSGSDLRQKWDTSRANRALTDQLRGGLPKSSDGTVDYGALTDMVLRNGAPLSTAEKFLPMIEAQRKDVDARKASEQFYRGMQDAFGGGQQQQSQQQQQPRNTSQTSGDAIASIESGGKYDALGPVTSSGDRAYGKFQIMGANIPQWTSEALGKPMTPDEFLRNPQAQEAVFQRKFGEYSQKYGPEGAARAWFAGEGGMNNPNAKDQLGTSVSQYAQKFNSLTSGSQPQQQMQNAQGVQIGQGITPTLAGVPLSKAIPTLIASTSNQHLPQATRESAKVMLQAALEEAKLPPDVKEYMFAVGQGEKRTFTEWQTALKQAGAMAVTNDMRGENAESAAIGKGAGDRANETINTARTATKRLYDINQSEALLANLKQGKVEPSRMNMSAWGKSLGLNDAFLESMGLDPKNVGNAQALGALVNKSVVSMIGQGGFPANNFSDADREFLTGTVERLSNDPRANQLILETGRRVAQRDIEKAKAWGEYRRANKKASYDDFETQWADSVARKDTFGDLRAQADQLVSMPTPQNQPQQQQPSQRATSVNEGMTATNPKTGQKIIFKGGKWVPM